MSINLNEEQLKVINELDKNIYLVAPAGTGKTNTLAIRISKIIKENRCSLKEILCITFTNKACKEMEERVLFELSKSDETKSLVKDITVKTFHGFCLQILKEEAKKKTDIFTDFTIYDEEDSLETLKFLKYYFKFPMKNLKSFIDLVKESRVRYGFVSIDEVTDYRNTINNLYKYYREKIEDVCKVKYKFEEELFKDLYKSGVHYIRAYNRELSNNHALDFNDLILKMEILLKDKDVVDRLSKRYKYINIDEVQDTSYFEYKIIEKIFKNNNILLCGDRFQTIYSWRGSEPKKIEEAFIKNYNPLYINFVKNYRATKLLTEMSKRYLENVSKDEFNEVYKSGITSNSEVIGEKVIVKEVNNQGEEALFLMQKIKELEKENKDLSKTCILTRDNRYSIGLSKSLNNMNYSKNFEFILVDEYKFFRRSEIKDIIAFLKLIVNNSDSTSLKRILLRLKTGIGEEKIKDILSAEYRSFGIKLTDFIDSKSDRGEFFSLLLEEVKKDNIIVFDVESTGTDVTKDQIIQIAAIRINKNGEVLEKFERFIKPTKSVGKSYLVHGFSDEKLKEIGEDKEKVFKDFLEFTKGRLIVGHNVQYDINILNSELSRINFKSHEFLDFYDTLDIYRRFYPNELNHKLEYLSKKFNTLHKPSHDAMDDIIATGELLIMAIEDKIKDTSINRLNLMQKHLKSFKEIKEKLNSLFIFSNNNEPSDIIIEILRNFDLLNRYPKEERENKKDRIIHFHNLVKEIKEDDISNRDSLIEVVNLTSLSNGEMEDIMTKKKGKIRIPIITVHQAKGLEFQNVFIVGLYDGGFPNFFSLKSKDISEEKRLFYVALTRAKERLYLSYPKAIRNTNGNIRNVLKSCLLNSISKEFIK
ncbi:UvrD-helicase domain-containing protein [Clostridium sp. LY3-2]|uniref:3'-5' exonuclease n=1 Tax=Clostridium sp. LY3-2 TaxID=2942482 RepID=UPI0021525ACF|nr:3'-5' exonuclease [Clostridium sp. LY3-2]MCR6515622.1 UvrD-helicase domain-containing protein [Clostridium sp. LY3-2]